MKIEMKMKVSAISLYNIIINSVVNEIQQIVNPEITIHDIKPGYSFKKKLMNKLGREEVSTVTILKNEKAHLYEAEFINNRGTNTISYRIEEIDTNTIRVIYYETYKGIHKTRDLNFMILQFLYTRKSRKAILRRLSLIERTIRLQDNNAYSL